MKPFLSILLLSFFLNFAVAQEKHFIFIQSDNQTPFNVTINGKVYSSSASGYIIIPKLMDGEYNFTIGFAQNAFPDQSFKTVINKKDLGYNLKNFGEKGWGLFNLQSLEVTMAGTQNATGTPVATTKVATKTEDEPISFDKPVTPVTPEVKADTTVLATQTTVTPAPILNTDSLIAVDNSAQEISAKESRRAARKARKKKADDETDIKKLSESQTTQGVSLSYSDDDGRSTDTIQVIIPSAVTKTDDEPVKDTIVTGSKEAPKPVVTKQKDDVKFLDVDMSSVKKTTDIAVEGSNEKTTVPALPAGCNALATDEDYTKLRRKMALQSNDQKMINEARKLYKDKCFSTKQIKGLSTLFMSDEGRYNFITASYSFVSDAAEYASLQSEFIDPAFVERFKRMLSK